MKIKPLILSLLLSILSLSTAFAADQTSQTSNPKIVSKNINAKEGIILATLIAIDNHEIAAADVASKRSTNPMVKNYAAELYKDHSQNLTEVLELSKTINVKPIDNRDVAALKKNGKKGLLKLKYLNKTQFDKAFIKAMIIGHTDALSKLKSAMKNTNNPQLQNFLTSTSKVVLHHLQVAKKIQGRLDSAADH